MFTLHLLKDVLREALFRLRYRCCCEHPNHGRFGACSYCPFHGRDPDVHPTDYEFAEARQR